MSIPPIRPSPYTPPPRRRQTPDPIPPVPPVHPITPEKPVRRDDDPLEWPDEPEKPKEPSERVRNSRTGTRHAVHRALTNNTIDIRV